MSKKLIRLKPVMAKTSKSRSSIYADMANNNFPKQVLTGSRSVAWDEEEIDQWINERIAVNTTQIAQLFAEC